MDNSAPVSSLADIDGETKLLVEQIKKCAIANTPIAVNNSHPYTIPKELLNLIRRKRKAYRKAVDSALTALTP